MHAVDAPCRQGLSRQIPAVVCRVAHKETSGIHRSTLSPEHHRHSNPKWCGSNYSQYPVICVPVTVCSHYKRQLIQLSMHKKWPTHPRIDDSRPMFSCSRFSYNENTLYMAPCHKTGRIAIAEDAPESSSGRSFGKSASHWSDPANDRK